MVRYIAEVSQVREVSLAGSADLDYWSRQLRPAGLRPVAEAGRARVLITTADARWGGVRFREIAFAVDVAGSGGAPAPGAAEAVFLVQAFNSSRLFHFFERYWFRTPYRHAAVTIDTRLPATVAIDARAGGSFRAQMGESVDRQPRTTSDERWEGTIYLPQRRARSQRYFYGRIGGRTALYPFTAADTVSVVAGAVPLFRQLRESEFAAHEWQIRDAADHARSQCYRCVPAVSSR